MPEILPQGYVGWFEIGSHIPEVQVWFSDGLAHMSVSVIILDNTIPNDPTFATGWYNFYRSQWEWSYTDNISTNYTHWCYPYELPKVTEMYRVINDYDATH